MKVEGLYDVIQQFVSAHCTEVASWNLSEGCMRRIGIGRDLLWGLHVAIRF